MKRIGSTIEFTQDKVGDWTFKVDGKELSGLQTVVISASYDDSTDVHVSFIAGIDNGQEAE